jgi:protein-tyrosine-phosphatase
MIAQVLEVPVSHRWGRVVSSIVLIASGCSQQPTADARATGPGAEQNQRAVMSRVDLYPQLAESIADRLAEIDQIPADRKASLAELASFVSRKVASGDPAHLTFICTHNSRRSHMSQIWAQTAAAYFGVADVESYSGGTEATAFNPRAVAAMERAGFRVEATTDDDNPVYEVRFNDEVEPMRAFSKVYDRPPNPTSDFAAVMTCSQADAACPLVLGATERIAITYRDPKEFDGTDREAAAYDERCRQIARELLYAFSLVESRSNAQPGA